MVFHCFKKWYTIIDYCPVCIMTDARSLTLFLRGRTHNNMLDQMSLMIAPYQPKIIWLKGMDNKIADMISRMPMVSNDTKLIPKYAWQEQKIHNLPEILNSYTVAQREIFCKSIGLMEEIPPETGIKLNAADNFSDSSQRPGCKRKLNC